LSRRGVSKENEGFQEDKLNSRKGGWGGGGTTYMVQDVFSAAIMVPYLSKTILNLNLTGVSTINIKEIFLAFVAFHLPPLKG